VDKPTSTFVGKPASPQVSNSTSGKTHKPTKLLVEKPVNPQIEKYTTHLRPETIKAIKIYGAEHDIDDYHVVQEALDQFFRQSKK